MHGVENLYHGGSRSLQDRFDTRRIADRLEEKTVRDTIDEADRAFIEARDMFFIATADAEGRPQSSYKGGDPGFVRVLDERTIAFPNYDGNGMYLTAGNMLVNPNVGLLFIDFEGRKRMRLNGVASVDENDPLLSEYPEAQFVIRVRATEVFPNCPRYIHEYKLVQRSGSCRRPTARRRFPAGRCANGRTTALPKDDPRVRPLARSRSNAVRLAPCRSSFCFPI